MKLCIFALWAYGIAMFIEHQAFSLELQWKRKHWSNGMPRVVWNRRAADFKNSRNNGIICGILELELAFVQQQIKIRSVICSYIFYIKTVAVLQYYDICSCSTTFNSMIVLDLNLNRHWILIFRNHIWGRSTSCFLSV